LLLQRQNIKSNEPTVRGKTIHTKNIQLKNRKRKTQVPTGLYELLLLTAPIEKVAHGQYKTILTILSFV